MSKTVRIIALVMIGVASLVSLWLATAMGMGLIVASIGLVFNVVFGIFFWQEKPWARNWLVARYVVTLLYAIVIGLAFGLVMIALFEALIAACILAVLIGRPSQLRAYAALIGYAVVLLVLGGILAVAVNQQRAFEELITGASSPKVYKSSYKYNVSMQRIPWKVLSTDQAAELLGVDIRDADLKVVRKDGSSFGLFFPLEFPNREMNDQLSAKLESEIRDRWLTDLRDWKRYDKKEGFFLTAQGEVDGVPVSYVIFYKHFGNLGVYAVFWSEKRNSKRLFKEAKQFYANLTAPPIKKRLETYTPAEIYEQNASAVVLVNMYDKDHKLIGRGTGFNLSPGGLILTNLHVISAGEVVEVVFPGREPHTEVLVAGVSGPKVDLALLKVDGAGLPVIKGFKSVAVAPGDVVYVIGNPKGLVNSLSEGIIGGVRHEGSVTMYQITAPISVGSSGGPVFNEYGEVVGVANSVVVNAQNINFSIAIDELDQLILLKEPMTMKKLREEVKRGAK